MLPVHAGVGTLVESVEVPDLVSITLESLGRMGHVGASGVCFKRDREGDFKAFEVNLRTNMWNSLALACGVNVPLAIWRDALDMPVEAVPGYRSGVRWLDLLNDLSAFRAYRREGEWRLLSYLHSLRSVRAFAYLDPRDPVPFFGRWAAEAASRLHRGWASLRG
jgi:predicted ATP-grasp superfamily ATP-dependent carboligase